MSHTISSTGPSLTKLALTKLSLTKLLAIGAVAALLVLTIGGALAERMAQRAASDRLFLGELGYGESHALPDAGHQG